ncbi:cation diffusion facilitator family transporter [Proteinivorax hydrogeniformans]|uniref:Cation diffusion facilitator family transporter n=1 Tax=Proteinivorax hydrogeniformans TaxID=1826727 RepID=A0AAU8HVZ3_9FIRM
MSKERYKEGLKVTVVGMIANILLTILKAVLGILSGSTALVADAAHSFTDIVGSGVVLGGLKWANQPADETHHYGHYKAESVVAKIIAIILVLTGGGIGYSAINVLLEGDIDVPGTVAIWALVISLFTKEGLFRYISFVGKKIQSSAVMADAWHQRTDALSSVAALVGVLGAILGLPFLDPAAGIIVSGMIMYSGARIFMDAVKELMDTAPEPETIEEIRGRVLEVKGLKELNDVKARWHGAKILVDLKICVDPKATVEKGHSIAAQAKEKLMSSMEDVGDVLIHVNPCNHIGDERNDEQCTACSRNKKGIKGVYIK